MSKHHVNEEDDNIKASAAEYVPFEDYQKDIITLRAQAAAASATPGTDHHGDDEGEDNNITSHPTAPTNPSTTTTPPAAGAAALVSSRSLPNIHDTDALTASDIAKPGGFRRHYIQATTTTSPNNNNDDDDGILTNTPEESNSRQTPLVENSSNAGNDLKVPLLSLPEDNNNNNTGTVPKRRDNKDDVTPRPTSFDDDYHDNNGDGGSSNIDINSPAIDDEDENHEALKESIMDNLTYMFDFFTDVENNNGYDDDRGGLFDDRTSKELALRVRPHKKSGIIKTILSIFKSFIGVGILFLPNAFHNGGWLFSCLCMILSALLSTIGMYKLSSCHERTHKTYPQMGYVAYGTIGYYTISFQLALSQFCFGITGVIYITNTLSHIVACIVSGDISEDAGVSESVREGLATNYDKIVHAFYVIVLLTYIPLSFIRRIGNMKFTNLVGDLCILLAVIFVLIAACRTLSSNGIADNVKAIEGDRMLSFIGTAVYSFEGIGLVIPIRESMAKPQYFNILLSCMITFMGLMLCAFGLIAYLAWGPTVEPVVLNQLPVTPTSIVIQLLYCLAVTCTFPITLYPTFTIMEIHIFKDIKPSMRRTWLKNALRTCETTLCVLLAYFAAEDVEMFVSFVGTFCSIPLAFILPAMLHRRLVGGSDISDTLLMVIGLVCIPITLYIDYTLWGATL